MINLQKPRLGMQLNRTHPLAKGLVGCWIFNEATGNKVFDLSGNGNNGTIHGADWVADGLDFVAANSDYIELPTLESDVESNDMGTITALIKTDTNDVKHVIYTHSDLSVHDKYIQLGVLNTNKIYFIYRSDSGSLGVHYKIIYSTTTIIPGNLYQVVFSSDGDNYKMYINGQEEVLILEGATINSGKWFADIVSTDYSDFIGKFHNSNGTEGFMDGVISYTYIYNRALSSAEIATLNAKPYIMFERPVNPAIMYYESIGGVQIPVFNHLYNQLR